MTTYQDDLKSARELGRNAYQEGKPPYALQDDEMLRIVCSYPPAERNELMNEWAESWEMAEQNDKCIAVL